MHPHPFLLPAFDGVAFESYDNLAPFIEAPFFGIAKLVAIRLANEPVSLARLGRYINQGSEKFVRFYFYFLCSVLTFFLLLQGVLFRRAQQFPDGHPLTSTIYRFFYSASRLCDLFFNSLSDEQVVHGWFLDPKSVSTTLLYASRPLFHFYLF